MVDDLKRKALRLESDNCSDTLLITDDDLDGVSCSGILDAFGVEHDLIITNCYNVESRINVSSFLEKGYKRIFIVDIMFKPSSEEILNELDKNFELHYIDHHKTSMYYRYLERSSIECEEDCSGAYLLYDYLLENGFKMKSEFDYNLLEKFATLVTYQDNSIWITEDYKMPWFLNIIYKELGYKEFLSDIKSLKFDVNKLIKLRRPLLSKETSMMCDFIDKKSKACVNFEYKGFNCSFMRIDKLLKEVGNIYLDEHRDVDILFMMTPSVVMVCSHKEHIDLEQLFFHVASAGGNKGKVMINISDGDLLSMLIFKLNGELI